MKLSKLPEKISICGKDYKVRYSRKRLTYKMNENKRSGNVLGYHLGLKGEIGISIGDKTDYNYCVDEIIDTIIHESLHAISQRFRLELKEAQVKHLAPAIQALFKDNLKLLDLLK